MQYTRRHSAVDILSLREMKRHPNGCPFRAYVNRKQKYTLTGRPPRDGRTVPIAVFLVSYLAVSLIIGDFYAIPITGAFLLAAIVAVAISRERKLSVRVRAVLPRHGRQQYNGDVE